MIETLICIGEAANKLVARLWDERHAAEVVLFVPGTTTNIGTPTPSKSKRSKADRNAGVGQ